MCIDVMTDVKAASDLVRWKNPLPGAAAAPRRHGSALRLVRAQTRSGVSLPRPGGRVPAAGPASRPDPKRLPPGAAPAPPAAGTRLCGRGLGAAHPSGVGRPLPAPSLRSGADERLASDTTAPGFVSPHGPHTPPTQIPPPPMGNPGLQTREDAPQSRGASPTSLLVSLPPGNPIDGGGCVHGELPATSFPAQGPLSRSPRCGGAGGVPCCTSVLRSGTASQRPRASGVLTRFMEPELFRRTPLWLAQSLAP